MAINIIIGFFLDRIFGDPQTKYHPVVIIGKLIKALEKLFFRVKNRYLGGVLTALFTLAVVMLVMIFINHLMGLLTLPAGINPVSIIFIYFLFCNKTMTDEAKAVFKYLKNDDIDGARRAVSRIVGRDTEKLGKREIIRATVETLAENIVDGFTSPFFYLLLGGLPLSYLYKAVNTLDSMIGYKNERYIQFGRFSARLDDILNYIPARINILFLYISTGFNSSVIKYILKYANLHSSPNSGISESAFSAYLGVALGGPSYYGGVLHNRAWLGKNRVDDETLERPELIVRAIELYWRVIYSTLFFGLIALFTLNLPLLFK